MGLFLASFVIALSDGAVEQDIVISV